MSSQRKSDTARANGAKSKGPKTAETREISSRNSLKHGIASRNTMLLACEDPALFQQLVDHYTAFYQPANVVERDLVEEIIGAKWRIRRLKTIEVALVDYEMESTAEDIRKKLTQFDIGIHMAISFKGAADESRALALLHRYESRLQRIYHRSHQAFLDLRRAMAAGLIGQPQVQAAAPVPPTPEPPCPDAKKKCENEPKSNVGQVGNLRPIDNRLPTTSTPPAKAPEEQASTPLKNAS